MDELIPFAETHIVDEAGRCKKWYDGYQVGMRDERKAILHVLFDLPIGNNIDYSRGYSAAVEAMRREVKERGAR